MRAGGDGGWVHRREGRFSRRYYVTRRYAMRVAGNDRKCPISSIGMVTDGLRSPFVSVHCRCHEKFALETPAGEWLERTAAARLFTDRSSDYVRLDTLRMPLLKYQRFVGATLTTNHLKDFPRSAKSNIECYSHSVSLFFFQRVIHHVLIFRSHFFRQTVDAESINWRALLRHVVSQITFPLATIYW